MSTSHDPGLPPERHPCTVALVSSHGTTPAMPTDVTVRVVRHPSEIRTSDDVVLFHGPGMAEELRRFRRETGSALPPAVVLAPRLDWSDVSAALDQGALGYLVENRYGFLLSHAIHHALRGESVLDPAITAEQVRIAVRGEADGRGSTDASIASPAVPSAGRASSVTLSRRERQTMTLLAAGCTVQEVARELSLSDKTVRNYLVHIYAKLNVRSRPQAILLWLEQEMRRLPDS